MFFNHWKHKAALAPGHYGPAVDGIWPAALVSPLLGLTQRMRKRGQASEQHPGLCSHCIDLNRSHGHPKHKEGWWVEDEGEPSKKWQWVWMNTEASVLTCEEHTQKCALPALDLDTGLHTLPPEDEAGGTPLQRIFPGASRQTDPLLPGHGLPPASASGTAPFDLRACALSATLQITPRLKIRWHYKLNLIKVGYSSMPFCLLFISRVSSAHVRKSCSPPCKSMEESHRITSQ